MEAKEFLQGVADLCKKYGSGCEGCPFGYIDDEYKHYINCMLTTKMPEDWDVGKIMKIFNDEQKALHDVVKIKLMPGGHMPEKKTAGAAAWDCYARIRNDFPPVGIKEIRDDEFGNKIPLGFAMELPKGYHAEIYPRSSLGTKTRLRVSNSVGIIDSDYRGEVCVVLDNIGGPIPFPFPYRICDEDRIAQMIIVKDPEVELVEADELSETKRGIGGFGSTGER